MDISSIKTAPAAPASTAHAAKLKKTASDMESVFIAQILKETRPKGGMMDHSFAAQTFQDMLGQQLAQDMAKKGVLGLADTLVRQLSPKPGTADAPVSDAPPQQGAS